MKPADSKSGIAVLQFLSIFLLFVGGATSFATDNMTSPISLTFTLGFAISMVATKIFQAQEKRICELESKIG